MFIKKITRRRVLKSLLLVVTLSPVAVFFKRYLSVKSLFNSVRIPVAEIPDNSAYLLKSNAVAVLRRDKEFYALSIKCPHLGCIINVSGDEFVCPCHGSVFKLTGEVVKGPALKNLKKIECTLVGEFVVLSLD
jgi:Rieske Fe-S protein